MDTFITVIHVIVCLFLVIVVLLQAGKGGGMGIAFGGSGGGGGSVFGGTGAGNFLTKLTVICAFLFMFTSMTLAYLASTSGDDPLKALSAKSRASAAERETQRKAILNPDEAPDGDDADETGGVSIPGGGASVPGTQSEAVPEAVRAPTPEAVPTPAPEADPTPTPNPTADPAPDPE